MMGFTKLISIHPTIITNVLIAALIGLALVYTKNPLVLLGLFALLFRSSQGFVPASELPPENTDAQGVVLEEEDGYGNNGIGFSAKI